jgi:hypothetical protein
MRSVRKDITYWQRLADSSPWEIYLTQLHNRVYRDYIGKLVEVPLSLEALGTYAEARTWVRRPGELLGALAAAGRRGVPRSWSDVVNAYHSLRGSGRGAGSSSGSGSGGSGRSSGRLGPPQEPDGGEYYDDADDATAVTAPPPDDHADEDDEDDDNDVDRHLAVLHADFNALAYLLALVDEAAAHLKLVANFAVDGYTIMPLVADPTGGSSSSSSSGGGNGHGGGGGGGGGGLSAASSSSFSWAGAYNTYHTYHVPLAGSGSTLGGPYDEDEADGDAHNIDTSRPSSTRSSSNRVGYGVDAMSPKTTHLLVSASAALLSPLLAPPSPPRRSVITSPGDHSPWLSPSPSGPVLHVTSSGTMLRLTLGGRVPRTSPGCPVPPPGGPTACPRRRPRTEPCPCARGPTAGRPRRSRWRRRRGRSGTCTRRYGGI